MSAKHQIHIRKALFNPFGHVFLFHHATTQCNNHARVTALLVFQGAYVAEHPVFRVFPYGTGVK